MQFPEPLISGRLVRRYKRFLADVTLDNGDSLVVHTANTGAMTGCCTPGSRVWLSHSDNPKRKYPHSWELVEVRPGVLCGINTMLSNKLVREAIEGGVVKELASYQSIHSEVRYGDENSRIDLLLQDDGSGQDHLCYVEVKNVTLVEGSTGYFPDAVTARGRKHLRELIKVVESGQRAVIFFCVQRGDCDEVRPAWAIDREYAETLRQALACGVEAIAYRARITPEIIELVERLPVFCE